jgi:hypothetical protein
VDPTFAVLLLSSALVCGGVALAIRVAARTHRPPPAGALRRLGGRPVSDDDDSSSTTGERGRAEHRLAAHGEQTAVGVVLLEIVAEDRCPRAQGDAPPFEAMVAVLGAAAGPDAHVYRFTSAVFCVILPGAGPEASLETARGIRCAALAAVARSDPPAEVVVGVAALRRKPLRALRLADAALYQAKMRGGNALVVAEVPLELRSG